MKNRKMIIECLKGALIGVALVAFILGFSYLIAVVAGL